MRYESEAPSNTFIHDHVFQPIQLYSCFISNSTEDQELATRLHNDPQVAGVRCWKWNHDARTGRQLWGEITDAIRLHEKVGLKPDVLEKVIADATDWKDPKKYAALRDKLIVDLKKARTVVQQ